MHRQQIYEWNKEIQQLYIYNCCVCVCLSVSIYIVFSGGSVGTESTCNAGDSGDLAGFNPWVEKMPSRRAWQSTPVFLHGASHGQRRLADYRVTKSRHD